MNLNLQSRHNEGPNSRACATTDRHRAAVNPFSFFLFLILIATAFLESGCPTWTGPAPASKTSSDSKADPNTSSGQLPFTPSSLNFGSVDIGSNSTLGVTFSNSGNASVTISNVSIAGPGFDASGLSTGLVLAPGSNATLNVTFSPAATGTATGSVTVSSDASNSPATISLSGSGTQSVSHSVELSWNVSTSSVVGYNIYRSGSSTGPYARLNASLTPGTIFTDSTVQAGQTYYYAVTSVNGNNAESGYSIPVSATIPTP